MTMSGSIVCIFGFAATIWILVLCLALCYEAAMTARREDEHRDLPTGDDPEAEAVHCCWAQLLFYWAEGSSVLLDGVVIAVSDRATTPVGTPFSLRITKPGHDLPRVVLRLMCLAGGGDKVRLRVRHVDGRQQLRLRGDGVDITVPLESAAGWPVPDPHGGLLWR
jgi:hypothetical protein